MSKLILFPWDKNEKPYFSNDGFDWYVDDFMTKYARKKLKDVVCFYVKKGDVIKRVLIDNKQNILHEDTTMDGMACKIDFLKLATTKL